MKTTSQLKNKKELLISILIISVIILSVSLAYVFGYKNKANDLQQNPIVSQGEGNSQISEQTTPLRQDTLKGTSDEEVMTYLYGNYDDKERTSNFNKIYFGTLESEQYTKFDEFEKVDGTLKNPIASVYKKVESNDGKQIVLIVRTLISGKDPSSYGNSFDSFYIFKKDNDYAISSISFSRIAKYGTFYESFDCGARKICFKKHSSFGNGENIENIDSVISVEDGKVTVTETNTTHTTVDGR